MAEGVRGKLMKINCISCGHSVDLRDAYEDYEGLIKCFVCGAVLEIRTNQGSLKSVRFVRTGPQPVAQDARS